jgi:hypothetical protein
MICNLQFHFLILQFDAERVHHCIAAPKVLAKDTVCKFDSLSASGHLFLTNKGSGQADSSFAQDK